MEHSVIRALFSNDEHRQDPQPIPAAHRFPRRATRSPNPEKIEGEANEEELQWLSLFRDTHELMDLCRAIQSDFLRETLETEADQVNQ
ncbi:MAG: hypothetical protein CMM01_20805 [Rhodopirellula sp.]|nr:hypothetical protein [Rhodopirellula sp.]